MSDNTNAALAASIAGGYLLGRSGKGKLALAVATYVASRKLQGGSRESATDGEDSSGAAAPSSASSPLSQLSEQVRTDLLSVGREAVKAALNQRLDAFADTLADRTKALNQRAETDEDDEPEGPEEARERAGGEDSGRSSKKERAQQRSTKSAASSSRKSTGEKSAKKAESTQHLNEGAKRAVRAAKHSSAEQSEKTRRRR